MKILAIEDAETQHFMLETIFKHINAQGVFCKTGEEGLEKLQNHYFDCVLLDLGLPGKSGLHVLKTIRENPLLKDMAIIITTATKTRETIQTCMRYGISDYIGKPYDVQKFVQKLQLIEQSLALKNSAGKPSAAQVTIERVGSLAKFIFAGAFTAESVRKFLSLYSSTFKAQTKNDSILLNLALLPAMNEPQARIFKIVLDAIEPKKALIIAGRSYGTLAASLDLVESQLFLIEDDVLEFLQKSA